MLMGIPGDANFRSLPFSVVFAPFKVVHDGILTFNVANWPFAYMAVKRGLIYDSTKDHQSFLSDTALSSTYSVRVFIGVSVRAFCERLRCTVSF
jgi:hypothetical protein